MDSEIQPTFSNTHNTTEAQADTFLPCSSDQSLFRWNVRFNALTDPRSFIERVEELQRCSGISDQKLFNSCSILFVDQAKLWFNGVREEVSSWVQLKSLLFEEFLPSDFDYRLLNDIRSRTQGIEEPTHMYFAVMTSLFNRLNRPLPESEKLEILLHNIRPEFNLQLALTPINSVSELKSKCRLIEAARQRSELFTEPTKLSHLSSEFVYKSKQRHATTVSDQFAAPIEENEDIRQVTGIQVRGRKNVRDVQVSNNVDRYYNNQQGKQFHQAQQGNFRSLQCYNCQGFGHIARQCREKATHRPIRCFRCGELGYFTHTCPKCKPQAKN